MKTKKTFLIINQTAGSPYHGMVYRNYYIAREWVKEGHKAIIISGSYFHNFSKIPETKGLFTKGEIDGIEYWWVRMPHYSKSKSFGRLLTLFIFPLLLLFFPFWRLSKPETVIVSGPPHLSIINAWLWARYWGATLVYEVRDIWPLTIIKLGKVSAWNPFILFLSFFERLAYMASDRVVSVLALANRHFEARGMTPVKFSYIPNGVDTSSEEMIEGDVSKKVAELAGSKKVVLYAGSFGIANNLDQLIDAANILHQDDRLHFVFVGDGPHKTHLLEKASNLNNVSFLGSVPKKEIPAILSHASITYVGLMKSDLFKHGVSPNKLFDYMAARKPVIMAIDTEDNIVGNAQCGAFVPSCTPEDIASAIFDLANKSDEALKKLGENGRAYLENNHTYKALAQKYIQVSEEGKRPIEEAARWIVSPFALGFILVFILGIISHFILPALAPHLFKDSMTIFLDDPHTYHRIALEVANAPWSDFTIRPKAQFPAGILGLLYKVTGIYRPFLFIPILAFLAGLTIRGIAACLDVLGVRGRWWPIVIALIFTVTPTSISWMIYPHKDAFIVPGVILLLWTFLSVTLRRIRLRHFLSLAVGCLLVFSSKPYFSELLLVGLLIALPFAWIQPASQIGKYGRMLFFIFSLGVFSLISFTFKGYSEAGKVSPKSLITNQESNQLPRHLSTKKNWRELPGGEVVNKPILGLAYTRERFLHQRSHGQTNFKPEVHLTSAIETLQFIPSALQLSLLEPLPWREMFGGRARQFVYFTLKLEMFFVYAALLFLLFSGRSSWKPSVLVCISLAVPFLLALGFAAPNIGAINRYRFPFLMIIKLAGFAALWNSSRFKWPGQLLMWIDPPNLNRKKKKLLFLVPDDDTFVIQRLVMAQAAQKAGFEVHVACPDLGHVQKIKDLGFIHHNVELNRGGLNPIADFSAFIKLTLFLAKLRPDILHNVSIKPVIYGSTAGTIVGLNRIVSLINGLGYAFEAKGIKGKIVLQIAKALYRNALALPGVRVIFQNPDDRNYFIENKLVDADKTVLIRGSGVNTKKFPYSPQLNHEKPVVLYVGRLLRSKGIDDLIEAAKILKREHIDFIVRVVGQPDERNPEALSKGYLEELQNQGIVELMGRQSDMPKFYREADLVVLPQQNREGLPLTLLEASSSGRAIVATDVPGCREVVRDGINGLKVPPKNPNELAKAIKLLILNPDLLKKYGEEGSRIVEAEFSAEIVQDKLIHLYKSLFPNEDINDGRYSVIPDPQ